jgi:hypothetical protein
MSTVLVALRKKFNFTLSGHCTLLKKLFGLKSTGYKESQEDTVKIRSEIMMTFYFRTAPFRSAFFQLTICGFQQNFQKQIRVLYFIPFFLTSCLEPYNPPATSSGIKILVVDGFVNSSEGVSTVRLSNANELSDPKKPSPETNAAVTISTDAGTSYQLTEQDSGFYTVGGLTLDSKHKYRVNISTSNGGEYASDYIELKQSPSLDVTWEATNEGVNILLNTKDPLGKTLYYRWSYAETWQYRAAYDSYYKLVGTKVVALTEEEKVFNCWSGSQSTHILVGSSTQLSEDIISNLPIMFLPKGSKKLEVKYSILVKQTALSKEEYDFWQQLKKNTESLGSLFDPQPTRVLGNIHNISNLSAPVLGYFSGGEVQEKRIFIDFYDLPNHLRIFDTRSDCSYDTILASDVAGLFEYERLINIVPLRGPVVAYSKTLTACADCREQDGVNLKPKFWPQ